MSKRWFSNGTSKYWVWDTNTRKAEWFNGQFQRSDLSEFTLEDVFTAGRVLNSLGYKEIPDPRPIRYFTTRMGEQLLTIRDGDDWATYYDSRVGKGHYPNVSRGWVNQDGQEFFPASLEAALDEVFSRPKVQRYFRITGVRAGLYVVSPAECSTYYYSRKSTATPAEHVTSLVKRSDVEEFFPGSLEAALDEVFPVEVKVTPKPRYFHYKDQENGGRILFYYTDGTTVKYVFGEDGGREDISGEYKSVQDLADDEELVEFHPKSHESAIRSRLYAKKYVEGKQNGEDEGYRKAKAEFDAKLAKMKAAVVAA